MESDKMVNFSGSDVFCSYEGIMDEDITMFEQYPNNDGQNEIVFAFWITIGCITLLAAFLRRFEPGLDV